MFIRVLYIFSMLITLLIRLTVFLENYNEYKMKQGDNQNGPEPFEGEHDSDTETDSGC